jgi:hypothetical protein
VTLPKWHSLFDGNDVVVSDCLLLAIASPFARRDQARGSNNAAIMTPVKHQYEYLQAT